MFKFNLLGKTRVPHRKNTTMSEPVRMMPPATLCIPTDPHIGAPATPIVKVGDSVKVGQLIAEATGYVSSPIHSPVSGKIVKIENMLRASGKKLPAIIIENDGLMSVCEDISPVSVTSIDSLVDALKNCGMVGLGGAGFPTAVKYDAFKKGNIHTIIINGAECEPYITSDARTMLDDADLIYEGISLFKRVLPTVKNYIIGIESNKPECIKKMKQVFEKDTDVKISSLPSLYPQGSEKVLIYNTTKIVVPEGKLPADVGVIVSNVTTLAAFAKYVKTGMPLIEKCITVDGSAVNEPKNVIVPIGTSIRDLIEFAGGLSCEPAKIIFGGPMTGRAAYSLDEPIVKTTNAVLMFSREDAEVPKSTACIHCGKCIDACPHSLNPTAFSKMLRIPDVDERMKRYEESRINLCVECGCCSFVCPAKRPLIEDIRIAKNSLKEYKAHMASLK